MILEAPAASEPRPPAHKQTVSGAKLGWNEGKNFIWEERYANYRDELLPELAADLVRLDVNVIVTVGTQAPLVAKQATARIPIVIYNAGDAVELGLAASLARPGGNITGLSWMFLGLSAKRLQFLTEMLPSATRLSLLYEQHNRMSELALAMPGYVSHKGYVAEDGERLTLFEWESADALRAWATHSEHVSVKVLGRQKFYSQYHLQVCELVRESKFMHDSRQSREIE